MKSPLESKKKHRSKSPSHAIPRSAECSTTAFDVISLFSGNKGFGIPFGNVPSGSFCILVNLRGSFSSSKSNVGPAQPFPEFVTMCMGLIVFGSMNSKSFSIYSAFISTSSIMGSVSRLDKD